MTYQEALRRASGHYLCRHLPKSWGDWEMDKVDKFIDRWKCELVEDQPVSVVYEYIETLAIDMLRIIKENHSEHQSNVNESTLQ